MRARVIVHSLEDAKAALEAATELSVPVTLESATGAGTYAGPRFFLALLAEATRDNPGADANLVVDCADEAGTALAALRAGCRCVRFTGSEEARAKLAQIAAAMGAAIVGATDAPALDLLDARDPLASCRAFLGGAGTAAGSHR